MRSCRIFEMTRDGFHGQRRGELSLSQRRASLFAYPPGRAGKINREPGVYGEGQMTAKWVAVLLLASPAGIAASQQQPAPAKQDQQQSQAPDQTKSSDQQDPLAAAASRAREQQKAQPRTTKVWDNDNLPNVSGGVSVVGTAATGSTEGPTSVAAAAPGSGGPAKSEPAEDRKAALQKQLDDAKAHLKSVKTDLDIATRTYQLDQQSFYSNPNYQSDTEGADKLKSEQSDIDSKRQEVADAEKKIDDLNSKLQDLQSEAAKPSKTP
jgi:hypothetical protein